MKISTERMSYVAGLWRLGWGEDSRFDTNARRRVGGEMHTLNFFLSLFCYLISKNLEPLILESERKRAGRPEKHRDTVRAWSSLLM